LVTIVGTQRNALTMIRSIRKGDDITTIARAQKKATTTINIEKVMTTIKMEKVTTIIRK
jgi:hypothetical protein